MNRVIALIAAGACAAVAVSSTCFAGEWSALPFQVAKTNDAGRVQFSIQHRQGGQRSNNWSNTLPLIDLQGLGAAQLTARQATALRFALVRPAGRFDCTGSARSSSGKGQCAFTGDEPFAAMLARRGIGRPNRDQAIRLAASDFRPAVLDALAAAGYPRPTLDEAVALGIFRIDPAYVRGLAGAGTPAGSIGDLVALRIHRVTPDYIASFARIGHRNLPADKLVAMRIFNVTAEDVRALDAGSVTSAGQRMRLRLAGLERGGRRRGD